LQVTKTNKPRGKKGTHILAAEDNGQNMADAYFDTQTEKEIFCLSSAVRQQPFNSENKYISEA